MGFAGNDQFFASAGSDTVDGGGGWDRLVFNIASSQATLIHNSNGSWTISGSGFSDTVANVEVAQFTDGTIALREPTRSDFIGGGATDALWRNNSTGAWGWSDVQNGNAWHDLGGSSAAYNVVGLGDFNGDGATDVLWRNNSTGAWGW